MRQLFARPRLAPGLPYLLLAGISSALIYGAILLRLPLRVLYVNRIQNLNHLPPQEWPSGVLLVGCVVLLFAGYALGALDLSSARRRLTPLLVVGFPLVFAALLLLTQPMTSTDVYDYLFRSHMLVHYGANTFVSVPKDFRSDPLFPYVAWPQAVTAYGPLWERMSWVVARLAAETPASPDSAASGLLLPLIVAYKGLAVLSFFLCGGAIWLALGRAAPQQRWLGLYLWLWNPLALWETIAAVHNDAWMVLLIVLALWAFGGHGSGVRGQGSDVGEQTQNYPHPLTPSPLHPFTRSVGAFLALTAGGLIKFVAFFLGPVVLAAALRRLPDWRARVRLILLGGLVCALFVVLAYVPFWAGQQTLRNVGDRSALFTASWLAALHVLLTWVVSQESAKTIAALGGLALLAAGVCWATWRAWRAPHTLAAQLLWLVLWFLFLCNPWFQPWYVIWPLALVAVQPWRTRAVLGICVFCMTALISYVVGGLLLPALGLSETAAEREALISAFIYIPPLIVLGWGRSLHPAVLWRSLRWPIDEPAVRL